MSFFVPVENQKKQYISINGEIIGNLNEKQKEFVETPLFQLALAFYVHLNDNNLPSAVSKLSELNKNLHYYSDENEVSENLARVRP